MTRRRRWKRRFERRRVRHEAMVRVLARRFARGDLDLQEDMYQEGLIALWAAEGLGADGGERWYDVALAVETRMLRVRRGEERGGERVSWEEMREKEEAEGDS